MSDFLRAFVDHAYENKKTLRVFSPRDCMVSVPAGRYSEERIALTGLFAIWNILRKNNFRAIYIPTPNSAIGIYARIACWLLGLSYATNKKAPYPSYIRKWIRDLDSLPEREVPIGELSANMLSIIAR